MERQPPSMSSSKSPSGSKKNRSGGSRSREISLTEGDATLRALHSASLNNMSASGSGSLPRRSQALKFPGDKSKSKSKSKSRSKASKFRLPLDPSVERHRASLDHEAEEESSQEFSAKMWGLILGGCLILFIVVALVLWACSGSGSKPLANPGASPNQGGSTPANGDKTKDAKAPKKDEGGFPTSFSDAWHRIKKDPMRAAMWVGGTIASCGLLWVVYWMTTSIKGPQATKVITHKAGQDLFTDIIGRGTVTTTCHREYGSKSNHAKLKQFGAGWHVPFVGGSYKNSNRKSDIRRIKGAGEFYVPVHPSKGGGYWKCRNTIHYGPQICEE